MACDNRTKVYLGYEDEYVTDKHRANINFMTNKIGGFPVSLLIFLKQSLSIFFDFRSFNQIFRVFWIFSNYFLVHSAI